jgi:LPLT family lysophospholipid transporter-like MFS transporter
VLYVIASLFNLYIPDTGVDHKPLKKNPYYLIHEFNHCLACSGATSWARSRSPSPRCSGALARRCSSSSSSGRKWRSASIFQNPRCCRAWLPSASPPAPSPRPFITLRKSVRVIPLGIAMGLIVLVMNFVHEIWMAIPLLILIGALSGFFVVPMNALLQHRGHILMGAGHSIAVQNFNENLSILVMTGLYYAMIKHDVSIYVVVTLFGICVSGLMYVIRRRHLANQLANDDVRHLDDNAHH